MFGLQRFLRSAFVLLAAAASVWIVCENTYWGPPHDEDGHGDAKSHSVNPTPAKSRLEKRTTFTDSASSELPIARALISLETPPSVFFNSQGEAGAEQGKGSKGVSVQWVLSRPFIIRKLITIVPSSN